MKQKFTRVQSAFLSDLDPMSDRWTEVLPQERRTAAALERRGVIQINRPASPAGSYWEARLTPSKDQSNLLGYMQGRGAS